MLFPFFDWLNSCFRDSCLITPPKYLSDLDFLLSASLRYSLTVFRKQSGSIFLADNGNGNIILRAAIDPQGNDHVGEVFNIGEGFSGLVASDRTPRLIRALARNDSFKLRSPARDNSSLISAPILASNGVLGVININSHTDCPPFEPHDLDKLVDLSGMVGRAIEKVLSYQKVVTENSRLHAKLRSMKGKRERIELELLRRKRSLESLLKAVPCGVVVFAEDLSISNMNRKAAEILGFECRPVGMQSLRHLPLEWKQGQLDSIANDVFRNKKGRTLCQMVRSVGHKTRALSLRFSPAGASSNDALTAVLEIRELSKEFQLEREVREYEDFNDVNTVAAAVAHEINGPLDGIMRLTRMSLQSLDSADPTHAMLSESLEKQKQIVAIGKSLATFIRRCGNEGQRSVTPGLLAREILDMYELRFRNERIHVHLHAAGEPASVHRFSLHCILDSIVGIALDWASKGATLSLSNIVCGDRLIVEARVELPDSAPSGPRPVLPGESQRSSYNMALAKRIVEHYNGTIRTEFNASKGGAILVNLPLEHITENKLDEGNCSAVDSPLRP